MLQSVILHQLVRKHSTQLVNLQILLIINNNHMCNVYTMNNYSLVIPTVSVVVAKSVLILTNIATVM